MKEANSYTGAMHVAKVLAGGLRGAAAARSAEIRTHAPHSCATVGCGRQPSYVLRTTGPNQQGLAWCATCVPIDPLEGDGHKYSHHDDNAKQASTYGACPLCDCGEAGGEHLILWCPVVAQVWKLIRKSPLPLPQAIKHGQDAKQVACILHQASYLTSTLADCPFVDLG